jgi:hypothetical protein
MSRTGTAVPPSPTASDCAPRDPDDARMEGTARARRPRGDAEETARGRRLELLVEELDKETISQSLSSITSVKGRHIVDFSLYEL